MTQDPRIDSYFEDLPAYALGALDPDARLALEAHLEGCPVCSAELEELADASSALAALVPAVEPPPGVKDGLMSRLDREVALQRALGREASHGRASARTHAWTDRIGLFVIRTRLRYVATVLAVAGVVAISAGVLVTFNRVDDLETQLSSEATAVTQAMAISKGALAKSNLLDDRVDDLETRLSAEATAVTELAQSVTVPVDEPLTEAEDTKQTVSRLAAANERLQKILRDQMRLISLRSIASTRTTFFTGIGPADDAIGTLVTGHRSDASGILMVYGLPAMQPGYVYQLWLIYNGERRNIGTFVVDSMGYAWLKVMLPEGGVEYLRGGVTIEPVPGSSAPTGTKVLDITPR